MTNDKNYRDSLSLLKTLVNINTSSYNQQGIETCLNIIKEKFDKFNCSITDITEPNSNKIIATTFTKKKPSLPNILFNIHVDTVFDETSPFQQFKIINNKMATGPGVIDAKGGIVIIYNTINQIENSSLKDKINWTVVLTTDEEIGSMNSKDYLIQEAKNHDIALIFEPPLENGNIIKNRPASANISITATGKTAHAGRQASHGIHAIQGLLNYIQDIQTKKNDDHGVINLGTLSGGTRENIIPDFAQCKINARFMKESDLNSYIQTCQETAKKLNKKNNAKISVSIDSLRPGKPATQKSDHLYDCLKKATKTLNRSIQFENSFGVCDGNFIASTNTPVIDTLGAIGSGMHTENETIELNSLIDQSLLTVTLIKEYIKNINTKC